MDTEVATLAVPLLDVIVRSGFSSKCRLDAVREWILGPECGIPSEERPHVIALMDALEAIRTCLDDTPLAMGDNS